MNNEQYLDHLLRVARLINACALKVKHQLEGVLPSEEESALISQSVMLQKKQMLINKQIANSIRTRTVIRSPSPEEVDKVKHCLDGLAADIDAVLSAKIAADCLKEGMDYIARL